MRGGKIKNNMTKKFVREVAELSASLTGRTVKEVAIISGLPVIIFSGEDRELNAVILTKKEVGQQVFIRKGQAEQNVI